MQWQSYWRTVVMFRHLPCIGAIAWMLAVLTEEVGASVENVLTGVSPTVPEPAAFAILGVGGLMLILRRRG